MAKRKRRTKERKITLEKLLSYAIFRKIFSDEYLYRRIPTTFVTAFVIYFLMSIVFITDKGQLLNHSANRAVIIFVLAIILIFFDPYWEHIKRTNAQIKRSRKQIRQGTMRKRRKS
jgi:uncharacterized membrane protein